MCDIYTAYCKECGEKISPQIHLNSYFTERNEINVYCERHTPDKNVVIYSKNDITLKNQSRIPRKYKIGIESLTPNAYENRFGNHPNDIDYHVKELDEFGKVIDEWDD
jgi:hypothetical protein